MSSPGRVEIFGDSLTGGRYGIGYGRFLEFEALLHGLDGQYMCQTLDRAIARCKDRPGLDVVVEAGLNDILLGGCGPDAFDGWKDRLGLLSSLCASLHVCALTPAGEDPDSSCNYTRACLNRELSVHSKAFGYAFIDTAGPLEAKMSGRDIQYEVLSVMFGDRKRIEGVPECDRESESMAISSERGFAVTTDGVHLNGVGARIFAEALNGAFRIGK